MYIIHLLICKSGLLILPKTFKKKITIHSKNAEPHKPTVLFGNKFNRMAYLPYGTMGFVCLSEIH